jgi:hypothetical protein
MENPRVAGRDPEGRFYFSFASFEDPDGNRWLLQEIKERLPGREWKLTPARVTDVATLAELLRETAEHHDPYEKTHVEHHWSNWYASYLSARQNGSSPAEAAAAADRYMEEVSSPITPLEWPHSFNNPDHVSIVIHNYGGGSDWLRASRDTTIWKRLSDASVITVPPLRSKVMRMERRIQTQCLREKILGQIFASDYQGRHRAQSASGSATGLRQGCRRRQWLLTN